ncbi:SGNH hydrolase [Trematosphaeria pertusa]|uniref:SGNH hydrolase n=1 Tax=Trematosphaeria pertusa TaxID=390896 RepID=A0A6A6IW45_9PLEO|nr:SGNH hydrolase [Trematosphaeria pertusa]KAF2253830.1 SGNH hydrolase [Trematosphaeria pertusa]
MPSLRLTLLLSAALLSCGSARQNLLKAPAVEHSWIRNFASIGDSYSAGLGSGDRLDWTCSRYAKSYPNILQNTLLERDEERQHQFLACSGATSTEILEKQVQALQHGIDLLTVSAGGNDIGLTPILSNCIYQFYMAGEDDCEKSIEEARERISDRAQLYSNISKLIDAALPKMNPDRGVVYVTGYAGFFGVEDEVCDNVTWAVWNSVESTKQYLKLELRKALNEMVRSVNAILRKVTEDVGPNVRFIDYDHHIEKARGRYCESGVQEPSPNRQGLSFYEWNTVDAGENSTELQHRTGDDVPKGSFEGGIAERINKTLQEHPDWQFDPDKGFVNKSRAGVGEEGLIEDTIHWMLPDSWKRVFHLRPEGHEIVARLLLEDLDARGPGRKEPEMEEL